MQRRSPHGRELFNNARGYCFMLEALPIAKSRKITCIVLLTLKMARPQKGASFLIVTMERNVLSLPSNREAQHICVAAMKYNICKLYVS